MTFKTTEGTFDNGVKNKWVYDENDRPTDRPGQTTAWAIQRREISRDRVPRDLHAANVSRAKDLVAVISAASLS